MRYLLIFISLLLVLIVAAGGFLVYRHFESINHQKFLLAQEEKCHDAGVEALKADQQEYGAENVDEPQYAYSEKLNICLYSGGYRFEGNSSSGISKGFLPHNCDASWEQWVKNSYTNEKILDISNFSNPTTCEWTQNVDDITKFQTQSEELLTSSN